MFKYAFLKMAFLNLWRRKSRTILVVLMLSFGLTTLIFSQGLYDGMMVQMTQDQIRTGTGEITIYRKGYEESKLLSDYIQNTTPIEQVLEQNGNVSHYVSRIRSEGVAASTKYAQGVKIFGIDIDQEQPFINYKKPLIEGKFYVDADKNQVMLGKKLAENLKVSIGKKIVIQGQALNKEIAAFAARVIGIIRTNNPEIDLSGVLMAKKQMQDLFKIDGVTEYCALIKDEQALFTTKDQISQGLSAQLNDEIEIFTWQELYPYMLLWDKVSRYFIYISYAIVFLVVAIGIFFILFISIMERIKEFGILMALGTPFISVCNIIFLESLLMGSLGYIIGASLGYLSLFYFQRFGLDLSYYASGLSDYGWASVMFPLIRFNYFVIGFVAMTISSIIAATIPIWKLKKLKAVEAIRFV